VRACSSHGWGPLTRWTAILAATIALVAMSACSDSSPDEPAAGSSDGRVDGTSTTEAPPEAVSPAWHAPAEETVVVPSAGPPAMAVATSATLYRQSPVVVLAADGDLAGQARAASIAIALGAPLLLVPGPGDPTQAVAVRNELTRLDPEVVLGVGGAAARWAQGLGLDVPVVAAPAAAGALRAFTGRGVRQEQAVAPEQLMDAVARLDRAGPALLAVNPGAGAVPEAGGGAPAADGDAGERAGADTGEQAGADAGGGVDPEADVPAVLRRVEPGTGLDGLLVLVARDPASVAAAATARASGARLLPVAHPDPRTDPAVVAALSEAPPGQVVALGTAFGPPDTLRYRLDVAASGVQLPGGGQILYPGRQMVALYGHPGSAALGVLGEQGVDGAIARARQFAADYEPQVDVPVVPAFEIITTVASAGAGPDGNYSYEAPVEDIRPWVDAAAEAGVYVVLDLQPGRTDFLTQAKRYEELLARPHVGLALDPEWRLGPDQRHLVQIGSVTAAEVNTVVTWLADLTRAHRLPQKLLLLHQFQLRMISDRHLVDTSRDELAVLIHADGFGSPGAKFETWNAMHANPPPNVWWGWKNFIDEDTPTFTPAETMAIEPRPLFVSYQ
jgi:hypothetical protein